MYNMNKEPKKSQDGYTIWTIPADLQALIEAS